MVSGRYIPPTSIGASDTFVFSLFLLEPLGQNFKVKGYLHVGQWRRRGHSGRRVPRTDAAKHAPAGQARKRRQYLSTWPLWRHASHGFPIIAVNTAAVYRL